MSKEHAPQQNNLDGEGFGVTPDTILNNKEVVVDFFGDNREKWYKLLSRSGVIHKKVILSSNEELPSETDPTVAMPTQQLPFDPSVITAERAKSIADFFSEYPAALVDFLEYSKWYTESPAPDDSTS
jgi:hypothetical protein